MNTLSVKIRDDLYYIGVNDRETSLFENQWPLPKGVTYNSYLLCSDQKTVLLDCVKITKVDEFIKNLKDALQGRRLDYLIINHMEPDHSGSIGFIKKLYPEVQLIGNKKTLGFLEGFYNIDPAECQVVKEGDCLDLGSHRLSFYMTPMVHWPESMVTYEETTKTLFSQDIFGGFGALDGPIFDDEIHWQYFADETSRYFTNIVAKYSRSAQAALKKLDGLEIQMICPVHGPVWRSNPQKILNLYKNLAGWRVQPGVCIVYGSMYGNTQKMAEVVARTLAEEGIGDVQVFDVSKTHASYLQNELWKYRGIILGSCTYNNALFPPMKNLIGILQENKMQNHGLGIFGTYSWSGGAVKDLTAFAEGEKFDRIDPIVETRYSAHEEDVVQLQELARNMAAYVKEHQAEDLENMLEL